METKIIQKDKNNIYFSATNSSEITPQMAKDAQRDIGYMVAGYGFYNFRTEVTREGNALATWMCAASCD